MPEYDPLILRDQLRGQIAHAIDNTDAADALWILVEYLQGVVEDIDNWEAAGA